MRKKLIVVISVVSILAVTLFATTYEQIEIRVHQHKVSPVATKQCEHGNSDLCTNLPIVSIESNGVLPEHKVKTLDDRGVSYSDDVACEVAEFNIEGEQNHLGDSPVIDTKAVFRYRGASSMYFDKKSYKISFLQDDGTKNPNKFVNMEKHDEWVLNGPFLDKTLIRNYLCMNIAGEIMSDVPRVNFCELIVNGEYQGVYLAMESVEQDKSRVDITKYTPGDVNSSYILSLDRNKDSDSKLNSFTTYTGVFTKSLEIAIVYPPIENLDEKMVEEIKDEFNLFEKSLYSFDYDDNKYGYKNLIDVDSFVEYFIINEFFNNTDAGMYSTYMHKDIGGKLTMGPVWDFNNALGNYMVLENDPYFSMYERPWFFMLTKDDDFVNSVIVQYRQLRKTTLSDKYLLNYIDETINWLGDSVDRNFEVWGYSFDPEKLDDSQRLSPIERNPTSHDEAIEQLKAFIVERGAWLDKNIEHLLQLSHESTNKSFNH